MDRRTKLAWISWWTEREAQAHALAIVFESQSSRLDTELILRVQPGPRKYQETQKVSGRMPTKCWLPPQLGDHWKKYACQRQLSVKADHSNRFPLLQMKLSMYMSSHNLAVRYGWLDDCGTAIVGQVVAYRYRSQWATASRNMVIVISNGDEDKASVYFEGLRLWWLTRNWAG